jgi:hypothetical protein
MTDPRLATSGPFVSGRGLRYLLSVVLHDVGRPMTLAELVDAVEAAGLAISGRPGKTVSDALRWEVRRGRVRRWGRGRYGPGTIPRSTLHWLRSNVREQLLS